MPFGESTVIRVEMDCPGFASKESQFRLGSRRAQLAAKSFWGPEMLQQRMGEMAEEATRTVPQNKAICFPSLRCHPQASSTSPSHSTDVSDSDSLSSSNTSPLLPGRKRTVKRTKSNLTTTTNSTIARSTSEDSLESGKSLELLPVKLGSKEAKLASTCFWGQGMLQKRMEEIARERGSVDTPKTPYLPPVSRHVRPQSSMARLPSTRTDVSQQRRHSLATTLKLSPRNSPITPLKY